MLLQPFAAVLRIQIRTYGFGPPGSGPEPLVRDTDPDPAPDPSIIKQKY
jgi:hypothetical protein